MSNHEGKCSLCADTSSSQMYAELYYMPYFCVAVKEESPSIAGVIIIAVNIIVFPASVVVGLVMTR